MLEDLAILTGGQVISEEKGLSLETATLDMLGTAEKVEIDKDNTTIVNGSGNKEAIDARVAQIRAQMETSTSDYDKEKMRSEERRVGKSVEISGRRMIKKKKKKIEGRR